MNMIILIEISLMKLYDNEGSSVSCIGVQNVLNHITNAFVTATFAKLIYDSVNRSISKITILKKMS